MIHSQNTALDKKARGTPLGINTWHMSSYSTAGQLHMCRRLPCGRTPESLCLDSPGLHSLCLFFMYFQLYHFAVINCSCEYDSSQESCVFTEFWAWGWRMQPLNAVVSEEGFPRETLNQWHVAEALFGNINIQVWSDRIWYLGGNRITWSETAAEPK